MMIKVVRLDKSEESFELVGHEGPVLQIDLGENMSSKYLASSSGDGTIKIWDLTEKKAFKTIDGLPKVNSFDGAKCLCRFFTTVFSAFTKFLVLN
jgi:chromosome transmission fidelity protein 4